MRDIAQEPTPRGEAGAAGEVAILHPTVQAFLDALAAWRLSKALDQDATAVASDGPGGHGAWDDIGMGDRREFEEIFGSRTSDSVQANHRQR